MGDELCSGTESISALSIITASIEELSKRETNFLFATHLHKLSEMEEIKKIQTLKCFHLKVLYDKKRDCLIYDRKICDGVGDTIYGLEVSKSVDIKKSIIDRAYEIRKKLLDKDKTLLYRNKSSYNSEIYLDGKCKICNINNVSEIHHIRFQSEADSNGFIGHIHKNHKSNLLPVCESCHNKIHNGLFHINGYKKTTDGIILDFQTKNKSKRNNKKLDKLKIEKVLSFKDKRLTQKRTKYLLKDMGIDISTNTISKIWNKKY